MGLLQKVEEFKKVDMRAKELESELRDSILKQFIELPYQMKEVEAAYPERNSYESKNIKVYYPVLDLPNGFSKEDENFIRKFANLVIHKYTLKDEEGMLVDVECKVCFDTIICNTEKGLIALKGFNIISSKIEYKIDVCGVKYCFDRQFNYEDMLQPILNDNVIRFDHYAMQETYRNAEKKYEEYLEVFGKTEEITALEEIVKSMPKEIQITPKLLVKLEIITEEVNGPVWMRENPKLHVCIKKAAFTRNVVKMQVYTSTGLKFDKQQFEYWKLEDEEKLKKGITLNEAIKLISE